MGTARLGFAGPKPSPMPPRSPTLRRLTAIFLTCTFIAAHAQAETAAPTAGGWKRRSGATRPAAAVHTRSQTDLVVIAPHPDDEALLASGLLLRATQANTRVAVIVMTNGDYDCQVDGLVRERESLAGLEALGVEEEDVYFMGYPDGHLARLGRVPLPPVRRKIDGKCHLGNHTYGDRGHGRQDFHKARFGTHAIYTAEQAVTDLTWLLEKLRPARVAITHPNDTHPDHAATYTLVKRALRRLSGAPELLRGLVHNGDCWPTGEGEGNRCQPASLSIDDPVPPLSGVLSGYEPDVRVPVPAECLSAEARDNPKLRAIAAHESQTHGDPKSYLFAFARSEEVFYSEKPEPSRAPDVLLRLRVPGRSAELRTPEKQTLHSARSEHYTLEINTSSLQAVVVRNTDTQHRPLNRWVLPHDALQHGTLNVELRLERQTAHGDVELGLYADDVLIGVTAVVGAAVTVTPEP